MKTLSAVCRDAEHVWTAVLHIILYMHLQKKKNICDNCHGELILREDDKPETVQKRLNVYHEQTQPLIDYYTEKNILVEVDGTVDIDEVFAAIVNVLGA